MSQQRANQLKDSQGRQFPPLELWGGEYSYFRTNFVSYRVVFVAHLRNRRQRANSVYFHRLFKSCVVVFTVVRPYHVVSYGIVNHRFKLRVCAQSFSVQCFVARYGTIVVSASGRLRPLQLSNQVRRVSRRFVGVVFGRDPFAPGQFPFVPCFPIKCFLCFPAKEEGHLL